MRNPNVERMQDQAERCFVQMQDADCGSDERLACLRWRAQSPAHEAAFRAVENIWRRSVELGDDPAIAETLREAERNKAVRPRMRVRFWLPSLVAVAAAAVLMVHWMPSLQQPDPPAIRYETALGERRSVALPDGTAIVLDTRTALAVRYSNTQRFVEIQTGQAQFQVRRDPARPFVVRAAGGSIKAVGTQFQVRVENAAAIVTLFEGLVLIKAPTGGLKTHKVATLSSGEQMRFNRDGQWSIERVDLEVASAWTQGSLFARNWRLTDLVAEMNRYSPTQLRLADPTLADVRISGTFRTGDQQSLVLALERGWAVHTEPGANGEILLSRRSVRRR